MQPRRLSWGRRDLSKHEVPRLSGEDTSKTIDERQPPHAKDRSSCTNGFNESAIRDQQTAQQCNQPVGNRIEEQQACQCLLREILAAILGEGGQLEHCQLTLPAVIAVLQHKLAETAKAGSRHRSAAARSLAKQQPGSSTKEVEDKAAKQLQDAIDKAAAAATQHKQEVQELQNQVVALQRQTKQLQGKCAVQARELKQATDALQASREQHQLLHAEVQGVRKQLQGKAAALSRSTSARHHEAAALKAELVSATAAAEAEAERQQQALQQAQQAHAAQVLRLQALHSSDVEQKLATSELAHRQQQHQVINRLQAQLRQEFASSIQMALQQQQQEQLEAVCMLSLVHQDCMQEAAMLVHGYKHQLLELHSELHSVTADVGEVVRLAAAQQTVLQGLLEEQARLAPGGLKALAQQAEAARAAHAAAVLQLETISLELAQLQSDSQQLRQQQGVLQAQKDALAAELQEVTSAAAHKQQQQTHHAHEMQHQLEQAHTLASKLQGQLQATQAELSASKLDASAVSKQLAERAASAEAAVGRTTREHQAQLQHLTAAYASGLGAVQQRLQWLSTAYFQPGTIPTPIAGGKSPGACCDAVCESNPQHISISASGAQHSPDRAKACTDQPTENDQDPWLSELHLVAQVDVGAAGSALSKLLQLRASLACDSDHLLHLFELYKQHKQDFLNAASTVSSDVLPISTASGDGHAPVTTTSSGSGACRLTHHINTEPGGAPSGVGSITAATLAEGACDCSKSAAVPDALQHVQQQVLQLEACLLKFMLGLQEALGDACRRSQHCTASCSSPQRSVGSSPLQLERPGTATSCSSRGAEVTSSLGAQLLAAMRREKQQLTPELRKATSMQRTPLTAAATTLPHPWQRNLPEQQLSGGAAAADDERREHRADTACMRISAAMTQLQEPVAFSAPDSAPGHSVTLQECGEDMDELLHLLQGAQLGRHSTCRPTGAPPGSECGSSATTHAGISPCRRSSATSLGSRPAAVQVDAGTRCPGRVVSFGHARAATAAAAMRKCSSCEAAVQTSSLRKAGLAARDRGIGSLQASRRQSGVKEV